LDPPCSSLLTYLRQHTDEELSEYMAKNPAAVRVVQTIPKATDLECHVRIVDVEGVRVIELRDFIPSLEEYGRGYWFPLNSDTIFSLINGMTDVAKSEGL